MQPGYEYKTLKIGKYVVSPTICYEIAFESIVLETASISNLFITCIFNSFIKLSNLGLISNLHRTNQTSIKNL